MPLYKGVILIGGPSRGTRFRPLSLEHPKPLFPVAGYPLLHHHLAALSRVQHLSTVYLIGFFEDAVLADALKSFHRAFPKLTIRYLREYQSLGTAGGLYHFRDEILRQEPDRIFVLHADVCCSLPLEEMMRFHKSHDGWCTILGKRVPREAAHNFGCLVSDPSTKEVLHYVEKPQTFISEMVNCGAYVFDTALFAEIKQALDTTLEDDDLPRQDERVRLEQDILRTFAGNKRMYVYETRDFWRPIKTAGSAVPVNAMYLQHFAKTQLKELAQNKPGMPEIVGNVYIHPTAIVDASSKIGPNVSIGANVVIGRGCRVKDAILLDQVSVGDHSCILYAVVGWESIIGNWVRIEGSPAPMFDDLSEGVRLNSSTILGKQVTVSDEVIIHNCVVLPHKELRSDCKNEIIM
jgi:mannose-1-phosphate guanylyltransferase